MKKEKLYILISASIMVGCSAMDRIFESKEESHCRNGLEELAQKNFDKSKLNELYWLYLAKVQRDCIYQKFQDHPAFSKIVYPTLNALIENSEKKSADLKDEKDKFELKMKEKREFLEKEGTTVNIKDKEKRINDYKLRIRNIKAKVMELQDELIKPNCSLMGNKIKVLTKDSVIFQGAATCGNETIYSDTIILTKYKKEHIIYGEAVSADDVYFWNSTPLVGSKMLSYSTRLKDDFAKANSRINDKISKLEKEHESIIKEIQSLEKEISPYIKLSEIIKSDTDKMEQLNRKINAEEKNLADYKSRSPKFIK